MASASAPEFRSAERAHARSRFHQHALVAISNRLGLDLAVRDRNVPQIERNRYVDGSTIQCGVSIKLGFELSVESRLLAIARFNSWH